MVVIIYEEMIDMAYPSSVGDIPHSVSAVMGYIGGAATNIWTEADWRRFDHYPKLPIFVATEKNSGTYDGWAAVMTMYRLGIPRDTALVIDTELRQSNADDYYTDFYNICRWSGAICWKYGSSNWIYDLPAMDGIGIADPTMVRHCLAGREYRFTQWYWGGKASPTTNYDLSEIHRHAMTHLAVDWTF